MRSESSAVKLKREGRSFKLSVAYYYISILCITIKKL
jgi:hypothetical protein